MQHEILLKAGAGYVGYPILPCYLAYRPNEGIHVTASQAPYPFPGTEFFSPRDRHIRLALVIARDEFHRLAAESTGLIHFSNGNRHALMDLPTLLGKSASQGVNIADLYGASGAGATPGRKYEEGNDYPATSAEHSAPSAAPKMGSGSLAAFYRTLVVHKREKKNKGREWGMESVAAVIRAGFR